MNEDICKLALRTYVESKAFNHCACFSVQEKSFIKFCKEADKEAQLQKHNVRYLMRVYYPSGFRLNSSNYDPLGFWRRRVQLVAHALN